MNFVRMGVGSFAVADPEEFAYTDINRQQGSAYNTVGKKKVDILKEAAKAINPDVEIKIFPEGLTEDNIDSFLEGASIVVDGVDFYCLKIRKRLFDEAKRLNIFLLSCPILGFGTSLAIFDPKGPSYDDFFGAIPDKLTPEYAMNFGLFFFPKFPKYVNVDAYLKAMKKESHIPSFATSCALSGAVTAAEALFILLGRKTPVRAPQVRNYDLYDAKVTIRNSQKKRVNPFEKLLKKQAK